MEAVPDTNCLKHFGFSNVYYGHTIYRDQLYTGNIIAVNHKKAMEFLFTTSLSIDNTDVVYEVYFDKEQYVFVPAANDKELPSFSFKREYDEWYDQDQLSPQLKTQAINALENYLLAQH